MQFFIDKLSFWVLQPYQAAVEYQGGQVYKRKLMGKLLRTPPAPSYNLPVNI